MLTRRADKRSSTGYCVKTCGACSTYHRVRLRSVLGLSLSRWRSLVSAVIFVVLFLLVAPAAQAQEEPRFKVSLVTMYPGPGVFTGFGHVAIRVQDREKDVDVSFDCGTYDSKDPLIGLHFLTGELEYNCSRNIYTNMLNWYLRDFDGALELVLDLPDEKTVPMLQKLLAMSEPGHSSYQYHHFFNNCSTKLRDLLDEALDGRLAAATKGKMTSESFRDLINASMGRPSLALARWLVFGLLNGEIDAPVDRWNRMFLPWHLAEETKALTPSVVVGQTSVKGGPQPFPGKPVIWPGLLAMLLTLLLFSWPLLLRRGRGVYLVQLAVFFVLSAFVGSMYLIGWTSGVYPEMALNLNVLLHNPLLLVPAALCLLALRWQRLLRPLRWFLRCWLAVALVLVLGKLSGLIMQDAVPLSTAVLCIGGPALLVFSRTGEKR